MHDLGAYDPVRENAAGILPDREGLLKELPGLLTTEGSEEGVDSACSRIASITGILKERFSMDVGMLQGIPGVQEKIGRLMEESREIDGRIDAMSDTGQIPEKSLSARNRQISNILIAFGLDTEGNILPESRRAQLMAASSSRVRGILEATR